MDTNPAHGANVGEVMSLLKSSNKGDVAVFKYWELLPLFSFFLVISIVLIAFSLYAGYRHGFMVGSIGFVFVAFFLLLSVNVVLGCSDVVIDDVDVSRNFSGWTWRAIPWNEIASIRVVDVSAPLAQKSRTIVTLISKKYADGKCRRNMAFARDVDMVGAFVSAMNQRITQYNIPVERMRAGLSAKLDHIGT